MDLNGIGLNAYDPAIITPAQPSGQTDSSGDASQALSAAPKDEAAVYEPSKNNAIYEPDMEKVRKMWSEHDSKVEQFRMLVETLLNKQAQKFDLAYDWYGKIDWNDPNQVEIDDETRAAATAEIEEGGYYSVEETAKRLLDFAVALSGGDPSKVDLLRGAVDQGFKEVEKIWGGELPEISKKTYEAVMNGFDEWANAGSASAISLLAKKTEA